MDLEVAENKTIPPANLLGTSKRLPTTCHEDNAPEKSSSVSLNEKATSDRCVLASGVLGVEMLTLVYFDSYRQSLVTFDAKAEDRLRRKIDWYIVPTVAVIYLFCFIDRANIGELSSSTHPGWEMLDLRLTTRLHVH
jgi:hypothetical protein